jgi:hypothetical protein
VTIERIALLLIYMAATVAAVVLANANTENSGVAIAIWWVASVVLGWGSRAPALALLAFLAIPMAIPFGYVNNYLGSDAPWVPLFAAAGGAVSALLIALSAFGARIYVRRHQSSSQVL